MVGDRLRIEVLGPLRVVDAIGADVTPDGALQRRLLALLVLHRGRAVTADAAIDVLWPSDLPRDPVAALQNQVSRLRRRLPDGLIESVADGYRLAPTVVEVDEELLADLLRARVLDADAMAVIDDALARWHGPAYPELVDIDDGRVESSRLDELRLRALEARAEGLLATGDVDRAQIELAALGDLEPLRERPRALLMEALARAGRTADALRVYDEFRRLLADELGIDPSPSLAAAHADLLSGSGPTTATAAPTSRVPVPVTTLIGRDDIAAELTARIDAHRLVTFLGPGGVGKTRLLVEVGTRLRAADPARPVVFCELAAAGADAAVDVVAAALAIDGRPGVDLTERIAAVLADAEVVLLLDNCEHVLDPIAALVERVLATCPNVRVVATSRERLRVAGEQLSPVPMLATASEDSAAVELFVERARTVLPSFEPDADDLARIVEIATRLDGLPLAIELAAARLHTLELQEIAAGLDRRFDLLSSGYRTSTRHGSLRAALSWSVDLLEAPLQHLLGDLATFAGSFTLADAAAVHGGDEAETATALGQLVERSLVARVSGRYALLETVRAYGVEIGTATGRSAAAEERHARHFVRWVGEADRRLLVEASVLTEIDDALPELRAAFGWLLTHDEVEQAGLLLISLRDYGIFRLRPDILAWSDRVVDADLDDASPLAPVVLAVSAYAAWLAGDAEHSAARCARALRVSEARGDGIPTVVATVNGNRALFEGRLDDASTWYQRAVDSEAGTEAQRLLARSTALLPLGYSGDPSAAAAADALLVEVGDASTAFAAYAWFCAGEIDLEVDRVRARERLTRALELAEATNTRFVIGTAGASKASIDARDGDPLAAAADYRSLLGHWRRAGVWSTQWTMLRSICLLLARLGRWDDAAILEGAVRATTEGHRIFGADEAALAELGVRARAELGEEGYEARRQEGAGLDGDAAVEHALRSL